VSALAARRRHPLATALVVLLGLLLTGVAYAAVMPSTADASTSTASADDIAQGQKLFIANCATCHGISAGGRDNAPSLIGVGAASVDFQVGTGRMPLQASGPQALKQPVHFDDQQVEQLSAYVASLGAGPSIPSAADIDPAQGDASKGAMVFRTNCAMCHNIAGAGGALTRGKFAPNLSGVSYKHIYEAMLTGPQSMPVFPNTTVDQAQKQDVIAYLATLRETPNVGGMSLGRLGPVSEGLVAWVLGLSLLIGFAVWLGAKSS
jgi:ubiquinol-cytochrome c reductase cytochrome c subunit